jgi:hypothetical protein
MARAKTVAAWRREVPVYDKAVRDVQDLLTGWPSLRRPRLVAHIDPNTHVVSIIVDGDKNQFHTADSTLINRYGYRPGGWAEETAYGRTFWRKTVTR